MAIDDNKIRTKNEFTAKYSYLATENNNIFGEIKYYESKVDNSKVFTKEKSIRDKNDIDIYKYEAEERLSLNNDYNLRLLGYYIDKEVSDDPVLVGVYEDFSYNLYDFLSCDQSLTNENLVKLFIDISTGLYHLQKNKMVHGDIRPEYIGEDNYGNFILLDRLNSTVKSNNIQYYNLKNKKHIFMAPIIYNTITQRQKTIRHNPFKSDTFSLGLLVLFLFLKNELKGVFAIKKFDADVLVQYLNKFYEEFKIGDTELYNKFKICLTNSLKIDQRERWDPIMIYNFLNSKENEFDDNFLNANLSNIGYTEECVKPRVIENEKYSQTDFNNNAETFKFKKVEKINISSNYNYTKTNVSSNNKNYNCVIYPTNVDDDNDLKYYDFIPELSESKRHVDFNKDNERIYLVDDRLKLEYKETGKILLPTNKQYSYVKNIYYKSIKNN